MTYHFEFFRHRCGRMISIHGEPCVCEQEASMEKPSPMMKSLRRLLRRAAARGHRPSVVHSNGYHGVVLFAGRHIRVNELGETTPDIVARHTPGGLRTDPHWKLSNANRWHAHNMNHAAYCRRNHMIRSAKFALDLATKERLRMSHD